MIFGIKASNLQLIPLTLPLLVMLIHSHFSFLWSALSRLFWIQTIHMGLNLTKQTKLDFVDFLWITVSLDWSTQMKWDKNNGIEDLI